jgi:hypothetical protein
LCSSVTACVGTHRLPPPARPLLEEGGFGVAGAAPSQQWVGAGVACGLEGGPWLGIAAQNLRRPQGAAGALRVDPMLAQKRRCTPTDLKNLQRAGPSHQDRSRPRSPTGSRSCSSGLRRRGSRRAPTSERGLVDVRPRAPGSRLPLAPAARHPSRREGASCPLPSACPAWAEGTVPRVRSRDPRELYPPGPGPPPPPAGPNAAGSWAALGAALGRVQLGGCLSPPLPSPPPPRWPRPPAPPPLRPEAPGPQPVGIRGGRR